MTHASPPVASTEAQRAPRPPWTSRHDLAKVPYRFEDRIVWKALHARQTRVLERWGCSDYMKGMWVLGIHSEEFPDHTHLNARLQAATCWELLVQHEALDPLKYFSHLARRRFPVRSTVAGSGCAPGRSTGTDLFHHLFGHVPMLAQPVFADYLQMLGQAACAAGAAALPLYLQHYERTADRGLIRTPRGLRMYGASLVCEATGELAGPANGFFVHGGGHVRLEDCCTIDSFEQLITTLPRTAPATDSPIGTAATGTRRLRRSLR